MNLLFGVYYGGDPVVFLITFAAIISIPILYVLFMDTFSKKYRAENLPFEVYEKKDLLNLSNITVKNYDALKNEVDLIINETITKEFALKIINNENIRCSYDSYKRKKRWKKEFEHTIIKILFEKLNDIDYIYFIHQVQWNVEYNKDKTINFTIKANVTVTNKFKNKQL